MKTINKILMIAAIIAMFHSCKDISELGSNTVKIPIVHPISKEDSLNLLDLKIIDLGKVRKDVEIYNYVLFNNLSLVDTVFIYSIKMKNNYGFEINPVNGYPVKIPPQQDNKDNRLLAKWSTYGLTSGSYGDTVLLNGSMVIKWFIKGNIFP